MEKKTALKLFEQKQVRTLWKEDEEKWYFSVQDVVGILSESTDVKQYIKKMRSRNPELNSNWGTICTPLKMLAADGKMRKIQTSDTEGGKVANVARKQLEKTTGKKIVSNKNAKILKSIDNNILDK